MSKDSDTTDGRPETADEAEEGSGQSEADVPRGDHPDVDVPGSPESGADGSGESDAGSDDAPAQDIDRLGSDVEVDAEIDEDVAEDDLLGGLQIESTDEIEVPDRLVDQVIGQDEARDIVKKAAKQRRHVMMIGSPGTGK